MTVQEAGGRDWPALSVFFPCALGSGGRTGTLPFPGCKRGVVRVLSLPHPAWAVSAGGGEAAEALALGRRRGQLDLGADRRLCDPG